MIKIRLPLIGLLAVSILGCQGAPQYAGTKSKADNELDLGWGRSLRLGAETDATVKGLSLPSGAKIDELTLKQSPGATMANGWVPAMDAYSRQQVNFVPILKQYGDNAIGITNAVFSGISQVAQVAMPAVTSYINGNTSVAMAKQQTKQLQTELVGGIAGGLLTPTQAGQVLQEMPHEVSTAVLSDPVVIAKLDQLSSELSALKSQIQSPATSQPGNP